MEIKKSSNFKHFLLVFMILILSINSSIGVEDVNSYDYLKLDISNIISFDVNFENNYDIKFVELDSYFLPKTINASQYLNKFESSSNSYQKIENLESEFLKFSFDKSSLKEKNSIENKFILESLKNRPQITTSVKYPIKNIKSEYLKYLRFEELIDTNDDIEKQASILASGEDDVFLISAKIAKWIREDITYDLKTALENPNQKSSEVFISKNGVCKEITNLYVSMIRSLGIPARVVSGYAYTNSQELIDFLNSNWGGHAWAEVLIGDTWVPFDLTYNQYGYVDASHIILERAKNSKSSSVKINGSGYGFNFAPNTLAIDNKFNLIKKEKLEKFDQSKSFDIKITGPNELGFNSYGYLKIEVENNENFYQVLFLNIIKVEEVELLDNPHKMIILKPNEKKEIYFRYKIPKLDSKYIYTLPFSFQNEFIEKNFNITAKVSFKSINKVELPKDSIEIKSFSNNDLLFDCNFIFSMPENNILCSVKNNNNFEINNVNLCIDNTNCKKIDLKLNEMTSINFYTKNFDEIISYSYYTNCDNQNKKDCYKFGDFKISESEPKLIVEKTLDGNYLNLSHKIENNHDGIIVEIFINSSKIGTFSNEFNQLIKLEKGVSKIEVKSIYLGKIIENIKFEVDVKKTKNELFQESLSFIEKIINYIKNLNLFKFE